MLDLESFYGLNVVVGEKEARTYQQLQVIFITLYQGLHFYELLRLESGMFSMQS